MSFPAYPDYQNSGVEWLGEVPSHWTVERLTHLYREAIEPGEEHLPILSVSIHSGVSDEEASPDGDRKITRSDDRTKYKKVLPGDLVYNMMRAWQGGFGAVQVPGMVSPAYVVARPRGDASSRYVELLLRTPGAVEEMRRLSRGITDFRLRLYWDEFKSIRVAMPPAIEREAILAFLEGEIGKIDALIEEQRHLIVLLKEKRQAVISHAVTNGLDPHVPMKYSGIEWLGDVPTHWTVAPLKRTAAVLAGYAFAANAFSQDSDNPRLLRGINLSASGIRWNEDTVYWERSKDDGLGAWELRAGDVVLGMDRPWIGDGLRVAEITDDDLPCMLLQRVAAVRAKCPSAQRFILHCLRHEAFFHHCAPDMTGVSVPHISGGQIEEFRMPVPPVEEMDAIAAHIENRTNQFAALISAAKSAIELLGERRSALISAAITGKIDVRGPSNVLPFPIDRIRARGLVATEIIERSASQATFGRVKFQKVVFLAEGHVGINELAGCYTRAAAGPLDSALIDEMEHGANSIAGIERDQPGGAGTTNSYRLSQPRGAHRQELADWLGPDRTAKLDKLIDDFAGLTTKQAEAVATLYGVWNDALNEGATPSDDQIIIGFLNDWHPEKREKFRASELPEWLGWMRRHGILPTGSGPKTTTGRLFV